MHNCVPYYDNSVITHMRVEKGKSIPQDIPDIFRKANEKYGLRVKEAVLTNKLFVEVTGQGAVRKEILQNCSSYIVSEKRKIIEKTKRNYTAYDEMIQQFILSAEKLFLPDIDFKR
ncbi:MAG: hypothetical protein LLG04_14480 [Parachlamydia sp.]|nr:hypothetical protein [Parachlamydia sp.]